MSKTNVKVTKDITKEILANIKKFRFDKVLVGIPEEKSDRKEEEGPSNAYLLAIHEFGSPQNNIPPRHPLATGMRLAKDEIAKELSKAAAAFLSAGTAAVDKYYDRAGLIAASSVKRVINDNIDMPEPPKATLKSRQSKGFEGTKSLVVTGQLRNAITWVVKKGFA